MKIIIGGGVAGLTLAYLDRDYKVFDQNPLGQIGNKYSLGPRLIQKNKETTDFIHNVLKLEIEHRVKVSNIGYLNGIICSNFAEESFKKEYSKITRGKSKYEKSFMSGQSSKIDHYIFPSEEDSYLFLFQHMLEVVGNRDQLIGEKVNFISTKSKFIQTEDGKYKYDSLVNTLNLNVFYKLIKESLPYEDWLKTTNKCFYVTKLSEYDMQLSQIYHYLYAINQNPQFTRKTFFKDYVVYESEKSIESDNINGEEIIFKLENLPIQIVDSKDIKQIDGVHMLGRYAQWKHSIRFDTLFPEIERIQNDRLF